MSTLLTISALEKRFGAEILFSGLSLNISEGEKLGIIGPNGSGKSTLLKIIAEKEEEDEGQIIRKRGLRVTYVSQSADFLEDISISSLAIKRANKYANSLHEAQRIVGLSLSELGFSDLEASCSSLSGGQKKRLQIALSLCEQPDLLLLDEPTNHLDIGSIVQLEKILRFAPFSWLAVSHDRWFLENAVERIVEINPIFPSCLLANNGGYREFLQRKSDFLEAQEKARSSLENKVRNEKKWLARSPKARTTKAKGRIDAAYSLMDSLSLIRARTQESSVDLSFSSSERKTKRLVEFFNVEKSFSDKTIFTDLSFKLNASQALGILGLNGSGKTTLVHMLTGALQPEKGTIKRAQELNISSFSQFDESNNISDPLKVYLAGKSDAVVFRAKEIHVASWAKRFQFSFEQLGQPYSALSGGEKARARIAKLMLETPDVLILDEPTNDLDIPTLEMLEEGLSEFAGALVLVSHDRFMINRLCTHFLGLDGMGGAKAYADYEQWEREVLVDKKKSDSVEEKNSETKPRSKASHEERKEYNSMERKISTLEKKIAEYEHTIGQIDPLAEKEKFEATCNMLSEAQEKTAALYQRWEELEKIV